MDDRPWWKKALRMGGKGAADAVVGELVKQAAIGLLATTGGAFLVAALRKNWDVWILSLSATAFVGGLIYFWNRHINSLRALRNAGPPSGGVSNPQGPSPPTGPASDTPLPLHTP